MRKKKTIEELEQEASKAAKLYEEHGGPYLYEKAINAKSKYLKALYEKNKKSTPARQCTIF